MPKFGNKSNSLLEQADEKLVRIADAAIQIIDFSIIYTFRDKELQDKLVAEGRSKTPFPTSKHNLNPSHAFDFAPYPIDWPQESELRKGVQNGDLKAINHYKKATARFYLVAGVLLATAHRLEIPVRWGGDWDGDFDIFDQTFDDIGHIELL